MLGVYIGNFPYYRTNRINRINKINLTNKSNDTIKIPSFICSIKKGAARWGSYS